MLKIIKINHNNSQKTPLKVQSNKEKQYVRNETDISQLIDESLKNKRLQLVLSHSKQENSFHSQLLMHLAQQTSIQSNMFAKIIQNVLNDLNKDNHQASIQILSKLINLKQDRKQIKHIFKSNKVKIEPIELLVLIWAQRERTQLWAYLQYMIECYPIELRLNANQYLMKWKQFIQQKDDQLKLEQSIWSKIANTQVINKIRQAVSKKGFQDISIQL